MSSRRPLAVALGVALLVPLAAAHGAAYDPLVVELHGFLTAEGTIVETAPAPAARPFPPATPAGADPLRFEMTAPVRFAPAGGFVLELTLRADGPVVTGDGLEVVVEPGGAPERAVLPPAMAPGTLVNVTVPVQGAAGYAKGDRIAVLLRPLAPALAEGALSLLVGGERPSTLILHDMRVPAPADLELQDADIRQFLLEGEAFVPPTGGVVNEYRVGHAVVTPPAAPAFSPNGTWVVLRGEETEAEAATHSFPDRERRTAAAHTFTVNDLVVRVHPGLAAVVPAATQPIRIKCIANCPEGGFFHTIAAPGAPSVPTEKPSTLVPPPRDTRGIPVSEDDAPEDKGIPVPTLLAIAALAFAAARRRR